MFRLTLLLAALTAVVVVPRAGDAQAEASARVRLATFNVSLNRPVRGQLGEELQSGDSPQARQIAEIIQRVRPDVLLLNEFDFDPELQAARGFLSHYLVVSQRGQMPIHYEHLFAAPVNTGEPSGHDLDNDGAIGGPGDAFGFGAFPGQYGMLVLSRYPIDREHARTFQRFLWRDMPGALLPDTPPFYDQAELQVLRLSSKSHWDVPIRIEDQTIHFLCAHPTPPVFDGPEDRNGRRNHDEIRFWADYVDPQRSGYIVDDAGVRGGLKASHFVIAGDQNADPQDGDSTSEAIQQLLSHPLVQGGFRPGSRGAVERSEQDGGVNQDQKNPAAQDTSDFDDTRAGNLRLDYVLPSKTLNIVDGHVFWPAAGEPGHDLVQASDHRLVYVDVDVPR